ncbi:MAG TPA: hypothetical protein VMU81_22835 [Acetobacteraceae bacterium]|nr:hypothetical protein [Acetobacteraceae bacterium]
MLVVTQDLVRRALVDGGQRGAPLADGQEFSGEASGCRASATALEPLFRGAPRGRCDGSLVSAAGSRTACWEARSLM